MARAPRSGQGAFDFGKPEPLPAPAPLPIAPVGLDGASRQALGADRVSEPIEEVPDFPHEPLIVRLPVPPADPATESSLREGRLRDLAIRLKIVRPLAFLDLETTGTSTERDRVLEVAVIMVAPDGRITRFRTLVNPDQPIPEEATGIHGISDDDVKDAPYFAGIAEQLAKDLAACDLVGFNLRKFDLKMLAAEFARAKVWFNPEEARVVDAMTIFHQKEKRDLESAVRFYCTRQHHGHRAEEDVLATIDVLHAQMARYEDLPQDVVALDDMCRGTRPDWLTKDGRVAWRDGAPRITFGKHNGKSLQELAKGNPDYLRWLVDKDFPEDTKRLALDALQGTFPSMPKPGPKK